MAIVTVEIFERTHEVRNRIIEGITDVLEVNDAIREEVQDVLYEKDAYTWSKGGKSFADRIAERGAAGEE